MIVPRYWAEARLREREKQRQITVRRFGWSDVSEADAQANAQSRAREALERIRAGDKLPRREPKVPYNGAQGVPIREEIVSEHGGVVVTRNAYGARCLNTPDVLFVDIDFAPPPAGRAVLLTALTALVIALIIGWFLRSAMLALMLGLLALLMPVLLTSWALRARVHLNGGPEQYARNGIKRYLQAHPEAHFRLYRTPAGLRLLAMHRTFDPAEPAVADCFKALNADPVYARMCANQRCFRARVSPKPWRMGIDSHMRPRPGTWPVAPERLAGRRQWIEVYEQKAQGFASCRFIETLGPAMATMATRSVRALHDELCRANSDLPLA